MKVGARGSLGLPKMTLQALFGRIGVTCWPMPRVCSMVVMKWKVAPLHPGVLCDPQKLRELRDALLSAVRDEDPEEFEPLPPGIEGWTRHDA